MIGPTLRRRKSAMCWLSVRWVEQCTRNCCTLPFVPEVPEARLDGTGIDVEAGIVLPLADLCREFTRGPGTLRHARFDQAFGTRRGLRLPAKDLPAIGGSNLPALPRAQFRDAADGRRHWDQSDRCCLCSGFPKTAAPLDACTAPKPDIETAVLLLKGAAVLAVSRAPDDGNDACALEEDRQPGGTHSRALHSRASISAF